MFFTPCLLTEGYSTLILFCLTGKNRVAVGSSGSALQGRADMFLHSYQKGSIGTWLSFTGKQAFKDIKACQALMRQIRELTSTFAF